MNDDPLAPDPMTDEELADLIRSEARGGYIPVTPSAGLVRIVGSVTSQITSDQGSIEMKRLPRPIGPSGGALGEAGKRAANAVKGGLKVVGGSAGGYLSYDAIVNWVDGNPETKAAVTEILERGGMEFEKLMNSAEGREIIATQAQRLGAEIGEQDYSEADAELARSRIDSSTGDAVLDRDIRYGEVKRVLQALNITSEEYITLLRAMSTHKIEDVLRFRDARRTYGLEPM